MFELALAHCRFRVGIRLFIVALASIMLFLNGCATAPSPEVNDQGAVMADIKRLNDALMTQLSALDRTGMRVRSEDAEVRLIVPDVFFGFGKWTLSSEARDAIAAAAGFLSLPEYRDHGLRIEGYTDAIGSEAFNQDLSEKRAEAVAQELLFSAIERERIDQVVGYGEANPLEPNTLTDGSDNPSGRARNRRVEIVIIDKRLTAGR